MITASMISTTGSRLACLGVQLIDRAALLYLADETHVDEPLRIGGLGARVAIGGEFEDNLDGSGRGVRHPRELFYDERLIGVFQGFAVLHAQVFLHDLQRCFAVAFSIMDRFDDDSNSSSNRVFIGLHVSAPG